jgi:hypothetical protein
MGFWQAGKHDIPECSFGEEFLRSGILVADGAVSVLEHLPDGGEVTFLPQVGPP